MILAKLLKTIDVRKVISFLQNENNELINISQRWPVL